LQLEHPLRRKCSPLLESVLLPGGSDLNVHEWKAVPDIWRTAAEKYPDLIAVIDPYHEPPTEWTYTQVRLWLQYEPLLMLDNLGLE